MSLKLDLKTGYLRPPPDDRNYTPFVTAMESLTHMRGNRSGEAEGIRYQTHDALERMGCVFLVKESPAERRAMRKIRRRHLFRRFRQKAWPSVRSYLVWWAGCWAAIELLMWAVRTR